MKHEKILGLGAILTMALGAGSANAETTWDMSVVWPEGNFHTENAKTFADRIAEVTDGEVKINVHSGGALGIKGAWAST